MAAIFATPEVMMHIETNGIGTPYPIQQREPYAPPPDLQRLTDRELSDSRNAGGFAWAYEQAGYWTDARCAIVVHAEWRVPLMFGAPPQARPGVVQLLQELTLKEEQRLEVGELVWDPMDDERKGRKSFRFPPHGETRALQTITTTFRACRYLVHDQSGVEPEKQDRNTYNIVEKYLQSVLKFGRPRNDNSEFWFAQESGNSGGPVQVVTASGVIGVIMPRIVRG